MPPPPHPARRAEGRGDAALPSLGLLARGGEMTVGSSSPRSMLRRALDVIVGWQLRYPARVLGVVAVLTVVSLGLATRLRVETGFESLLPQSRPSVIELHRVSARTSSQSIIFVVLEGQD